MGDWLALLEIDEPIGGVFSGEITVAEALVAVGQARERWPGVAQDYVVIVDAVARKVAALREVIAQQNQVLAKIRAELATVSVPAEFPIQVDPIPLPDDRLLNANERARMARLPEDMEKITEANEAWAEYLRQEADDYEEEVSADADDEGDDGANLEYVDVEGDW